MKTILVNVLAVLVGLFLGSMVNMGLVVIGPQVIPPPAGVDMSDTKSLVASIHLLEPKHFLFPFLAHAIGSFAGSLATHLVARTRRTLLGLVIGVLSLSGGIAASFIIPAPGWFVGLDLIVAYIPMAWLGTRIGGRLRA